MTATQTSPGTAPHGGIVVSAHPAATEAGRRALVVGGNAIDAAVASAWALCVCEPSGSGLGGQTLALVQAGGRAFAIDGHSYAPSQVSRQTVSRSQQRRGYRATTVPTTPATLSYLQSRYGRLQPAEVLASAIDLAELGYEVSNLQHRQLRWCRTRLAASATTAHFLHDGRPYEPGETFAQPALAACLRRLAESGVEDFYRGAIGRAIDRDMRRNGGLLQLADLRAMQTPVEREPIGAEYRDHLVMTTPSPGGGPQLLHALDELDRGDRRGWLDQPDGWYQAIALAVRSAFENREREHRRPRSRRETHALHGSPGEQGGETTHLCTADSEGNIVSLTQSIQSLFGAKVANADYGFLYNNYLTTCPRRSHAHRLRGGCSARSNAAPTLVFPADTPYPVLALGAAGSRRITSSIVQVISGVLDLDMTLSQALGHARIHPLLRGKVLLERPAATARLVAWLGEHLGEVQVRPEHSYTMGAVQALQITAGSELRAAADPRRDGNALRS